MSDHYCCKGCGLRYDDCRCPPVVSPQPAKLAKPKKIKVPKGWRLVPIVPTDEMCLADWDVTMSQAHTNTGVSEAAWAAMLSKSPKPPKGWKNPKDDESS